MKSISLDLAHMLKMYTAAVARFLCVLVTNAQLP